MWKQENLIIVNYLWLKIDYYFGEDKENEKIKNIYSFWKKENNNWKKKEKKKLKLKIIIYKKMKIKEEFLNKKND